MPDRNVRPYTANLRQREQCAASERADCRATSSRPRPRLQFDKMLIGREDYSAGVIGHPQRVGRPGEFDGRECPSGGLAFSVPLAVQKASFRALALSVSDQQHRDSDLKDEVHLIDESLRGDSQAFGELVHRYQDRLYSAVVHIVRCRAEAEDVVQEAFVQAYVKLQTFKHNSRFYTWLYRIAVNVSISHRRRRKIEVSVEQNREATGDEPLDAFTSPSEPLEQAERKQKLEHALTLLTEEHRSIIVLRHMEEFSYEEIADILDISVGTVRSRLHRARAQLLVHLKKVMPDEAAEFEE